MGNTNLDKHCGTLLGLAIKESKGGPMVLLQKGVIKTNSGLNKDARGKPGKRQITILTEEAWNACCQELGKSLPWTLRRANLLVSGLDLRNTSGKQIHINNIVLEITGETTPCQVMDKGHEGLQKALTPHWRGGVICKVIQGGELSIGDEMHLTH